MLYHCFASFKQSLLDFFKLLDSRLILMTGILGDTFSYIVMQVIWCLKFCNMTKSGGTIPPFQILRGTCPRPPPVIYAHVHTYAIVWLYKSYNQWGSPMTSGLIGLKKWNWEVWTTLHMLHTRCVSALFYWKTKLLSAMCLVAINIFLSW